MNSLDHKKITTRLLSTAGETLIEVLVSLTVIMLSGAAATTIVVTALQTTILSENYLIAQNLAEEAVEVVKNLRDRNHMLYPLYTEDCWLYIDYTGTDCTGPSTAEMTADTNYIAVFNAYAERWEIERVNTAIDLKEDMESTDSYALFTDESGRYTHDPDGEPTKFSRGLRVVEKDEDKVKIIVIVQWEDGNTIGHFETGNTLITNYKWF